jgi:hypothetical protein
LGLVEFFGILRFAQDDGKDNGNGKGRQRQRQATADARAQLFPGGEVIDRV